MNFFTEYGAVKMKMTYNSDMKNVSRFNAVKENSYWTLMIW